MPLLLLSQTDYNIISINPETLGRGVEVIPGILYYYLLLYFVIFHGYGLYLLIKKYRNSVGIKKLQILYIIIGISLTLIWGVSTNLILILLNFSSYAFLGSISALFFLGFTTYAIVKYRLLDIRVIIRRSAVFAVLVALITSIYSLLAYVISMFFQGIIGTQSIVLNGVITAVLVAVGFEPLKQWLSRVTDKFLFKAEYNAQEVLAEFSDKLTTSLDLHKINKFIVRRLDKVFKPNFVSVFLLDEDKKKYFRAAVKGQPIKRTATIDPKIFDKVFAYLKSIDQEKEIIVRDEMIKINEQLNNPVLKILVTQFEAHGINLAVPMYLREKLVGILFFGDKKSGDVYSQEDLKVLEIIASQSATAIENSSLYKEVIDLNKNLKKRVSAQTKDIVKKNKKLEQLLLVKSEFLDIASHQLRTPVSVINGILDMFRSGTMDKLPKAKQMEFIGNAFTKGKKLNAVINDILDASDLDEKELDLSGNLTKLNFSELLVNVIEYSKMEAKDKQIGINTDILKDIMVKGDTKYLEQAIGNLIDNAIKYTSATKNIEISLNSQNGKAILKIKDNGIGIPKNEQKKIFQKFSRASNAKEMHTDGSGLGLFIVKKVIDAHPGANVWFESKLGHGTTFFIELKTI